MSVVTRHLHSSKSLCPCSRCRCFRCSECGTKFHSNADRLFCEYQCKQKAAEEAKELAFRAMQAHVAKALMDGRPSRPFVLGDVSTHSQLCPSPSRGTPLIGHFSAPPGRHNRLDCPTVALRVSHSNDFTTTVPSPTGKEGVDRASNNHKRSAAGQTSLDGSCSDSRQTESTPMTTPPTYSSSATSLETSFIEPNVGSRETTPSQVIKDPEHVLREANNLCRVAYPPATSNTSHTSLFPSPNAGLAMGPYQEETESTLLADPIALLHSSTTASLNTLSQSSSAPPLISSRSPSSTSTRTEALLRASSARIPLANVSRASDAAHPMLAVALDGIAPYFETDSLEELSTPLSANSGVSSSSSESPTVKTTESPSTQRHAGATPAESRRNLKQGKSMPIVSASYYRILAQPRLSLPHTHFASLGWIDNPELTPPSGTPPDVGVLGTSKHPM